MSLTLYLLAAAGLLLFLALRGKKQEGRLEERTKTKDKDIKVLKEIHNEERKTNSENSAMRLDADKRSRVRRKYDKGEPD